MRKIAVLALLPGLFALFLCGCFLINAQTAVIPNGGTLPEHRLCSKMLIGMAEENVSGFSIDS